MAGKGICLGVDCRALVRPRSGIRTYLEGMLKALSERKSVTRFILFTDFPDQLEYGWLDRRHEQVSVPASASSRSPGRNLLGPLWLHLRLPRYIRRSDVDLFWTPEWALPWRLAVPGVVTVHDVIPLESPMRSHPWLWRAYYGLSIRSAVRRAVGTVVDSQTTRQRMLQFLQVLPEKTSVIPLGVDAASWPEPPKAAVSALRQGFGIEGAMLLTVGELSDRKNVAVLVRAMGLLPESLCQNLHLVIVGPDACDAARIRQTVRNLGLQRQVHFAGYVNDRDLPTYFAAADAFVFPSLAEGFGLPPLEAMARGLPVICSNASCLPETVGAAALLVPPTDAPAWAEAITRLLTDDALRISLVCLGKERAATFTWSAAAEKLENVFVHALKATSAGQPGG